MTREEKMFAYGLTDDEMNSDVDALSEETRYWRFIVEFGGRFGYPHMFGVGYGYFDGENFRRRPDNVTDEDEIALIKESLRQKKDLFVEQWTNIIKFPDDLIY